MRNKMLFVPALLALCAVSAAAQEAVNAAWKTSFRLDERVRVERKDNFDFNNATDDHGGYLYQRIRLNVKKELPGKYEFFAEGVDAQEASYNLPRPAQDDVFDLHQAYARVTGLWADLPLELKVGRQEFQYGKSRLLGAPSWNNRMSHLDAAVLKYKKNGLAADVFYGSRITYQRDNWNEPNRHDMLSGLYVSYRKDKDAPLAEAYFLSNQDSQDLAALNRHTAGLRAQANLPLGLALDAELPYQFGRSAGKDVYAWALHADLSREFKGKWSPRAAAAYNFASGDKDKNDGENNSFTPLYQFTHDPYGVMDLFRWQNMKDAELELSVKPLAEVKVTAGTSVFWLARTSDYWYDYTGRKVRPTIASAASPYAGQEVSLLLKWDLGHGAMLDAGYAHFFAGRYLKDTGAHDDADYGYLQLGFKL
ncbi:MAG TPA: hypothetical protein DCZ92_08650 [Elusimicrobia bacterium]|nr:MAG: hypothetical protein A2016_01870 [Elusimicrobia bacterium GWF2_62_30]HBA60874.1 hypothetical protein [Elusimicrobiota bacterium]